MDSKTLTHCGVWAVAISSLFLGALVAQAGRPVSENLTRNELIKRSDFVFAGWPSREAPVAACPHEIGRWWVHKVLRGDRSLTGKVIGIAAFNYQSHSGSIDRDQSTSYLFTNRRADGCFELVADGAQEHRFNEAEIEALFAGSKECDVVLRGFESLAGKMPVDCVTDGDCKLFYTHPNSCERPFTWSKVAEAKLDENFKTLQSRARTACADRWSGQAACSPQVFPIRCREKKCEIGRSSTAPKVRFTEGTIQESCAPHDASSVMISVTDGHGEYPLFTLNWWGAGKPNLRGGVFTIQSKKPAMENGFQASFCPYQGGCRSLKSVEIKLEWKGGGSEGALDFSFTTDEGETYSGRVPLKHRKPPGPVYCG